VYTFLSMTEFQGKIYLWVRDNTGPFTIEAEGFLQRRELSTLKPGEWFIDDEKVYAKTSGTLLVDRDGMFYTPAHFPCKVFAVPA